MTRSARGGPAVSIGVQLVALIGACLLFTHLLVFAAIVLLPPPRPPLYRLSEVAAALQGGPLTARMGQPLVRSLADAPPRADGRDRRGRRTSEDLAQILGRPADDVRVVAAPPSVLESLLRPERRFAGSLLSPRGEPPPPPEARNPAVGPSGVRPTEPGPPASGSPPPPRARRGPPRDLIVGDFTAALRRQDGRWTIVRSTPEPFPTEWQKRALLILLGGFVVVAPAGLLFARRITAPLKRFSEAAERLGRDPHAAPAALSGPAEMGAAARAFNDMQARLRRYIDDRTAMVGAISHDLRTPLARIRFKLERADPGVRDSILTDVAQMEQMIQGVLAFIRDESTPRTREALDLLSLLECVVDDAALVGGDAEIVSGEPVEVEGDPVALQRLFANLVDNALKHAGQARVSVSRQGGQAVVEIRDAGPGLSPEDLERVFQPFYRVDAARNVDDGGIGLGLPIARSTARAHGGDVVLSRANPGLTARVVIPTLWRPH